MLRWFLVFFFLATVFGLGAWQLRAPDTTQWQRVAPGVEMRQFPISSPSIFGNGQIIAVRTTPARLRVLQGTTRAVGQWRKDAKAVATINGGFFDKDGKTLGLRIADGKKKSNLHNANWGVFFLERTSQGKLVPKIIHTRDYKQNKSAARNITQALQCGPRLVVNGKTTDLKPQTARRTGIGIQKDGKVVIAVSDSALLFEDWAKLWTQRDGLNCENALNLDGGGSTQLSLQTHAKSVEVTGAWPVPDIIAVH